MRLIVRAELSKVWLNIFKLYLWLMVVPNIEIGMWVKKVIDFDAAGIYTF